MCILKQQPYCECLQFKTFTDVECSHQGTKVPPNKHVETAGGMSKSYIGGCETHSMTIENKRVDKPVAEDTINKNTF